MIYVWHHVVTLVLAAGAGWVMTRARWTHRSPRLAVLLWHAAVFGVLTAAVGLLLSGGLAPYGRGIVPALGELTADLQAGALPPALTAAHLVAVVTGLLLAGAVLAAQGHSTWRLWRQRSRQHLLLRLVAHADARSRALILDHPAAAAYYLPGPSGCVVISTGAIRALTEPELAAVLAHEHAHARGRHHLALAPFHALRRAIPCRPVARAAACVELLVEMCADDHAARQHGHTALTSALRRFHELGDRCTPPGALAAADHDIALRIQRLHSHPTRIRRPLRWTISVAALAVATTPISLFVLPA
jgi:hypothetical protein